MVAFFSLACSLLRFSISSGSVGCWSMSACLSLLLYVLLLVCLDVVGAHRVSVGARGCGGFEAVDVPVGAAHDPSVRSWIYLLIYGQCRPAFAGGSTCALMASSVIEQGERGSVVCLVAAKMLLRINHTRDQYLTCLAVSHQAVNITFWYRHVGCSKSVKPRKRCNFRELHVITYSKKFEIS